MLLFSQHLSQIAAPSLLITDTTNKSIDSPEQLNYQAAGDIPSSLWRRCDMDDTVEVYPKFQETKPGSSVSVVLEHSPPDDCSIA